MLNPELISVCIIFLIEINGNYLSARSWISNQLLQSLHGVLTGLFLSFETQINTDNTLA